MALRSILPQPSATQPLSLEPALTPLAAVLTLALANDPAYGQPFADALAEALGYLAAGVAYEPYNAVYYRIQSASQPGMWHYLTLHACPCVTAGAWCWHRALLYLLTAQAALLQLERCPRPTAEHGGSAPHALDAIVRGADELC